MPDVPDIDLPVWSIKLNWRGGILERLGFLTDLMPATYGTEQSRGLRLSPRRSFEMTFNPVGSARSYFDLFLHRMGSLEFMVPLFHDAGRLTAPIAIDATTIPFDTTFREFVEGGLAILIGDDPFTFDVLEIAAVADDSITVSVGNVTRAWPARSAIHPLRRARLSDESQAAALTDNIGEATLQFELNQQNDIPDLGEWVVTYGDYPVLLDKPNRRESLDLTFTRNRQLLDNDHGLREIKDDAGRAFTVQTHNRMLRGREDHWAYRQFLYRLDGRRSPIWVPTFNTDLVLSRDADAADDSIVVKKIGYNYTGGAVSGRKHVKIGDAYYEIDGVSGAPTTAEERLDLTAALGADFAAGTRISFMEPCRLAGDDIEIQHHTDTDGAAETTIGFRAFRDEREAPDPIDLPIPDAVMTDTQCGDFYPPLPFKFTTNIPNPLPTFLTLASGLSFQFILPLLMPNGQKLGLFIVCGMSKVISWGLYDLVTGDYTLGSGGVVADGVNEPASNPYIVNASFEVGPYSCAARLIRTADNFTFELDPPSNGDIRIVIDQWTEDYSVAPWSPINDFADYVPRLSLFSTESTDDGASDIYMAFPWNTKMLGGPNETLISTPIQKAFNTVAVTPYFQYAIALGILPVDEYDPGVL